MSHECPTCGDVFETRRGLSVHHTLLHDERLPNRTCTNCGQSFHSGYEKKYCSPDCREDAVSYEGESNPNFAGGKETAECRRCGGEFSYYPSVKPGIYCPDCVQAGGWQTPARLDGSSNPQWKGGKSQQQCAVCGDAVERYPSEIDGDVVLCGRECHASWLSEAFSGEGHPNWKGGGNESYGAGWNAIRRKALERDGYSCMLCSKTKAELGRNPDVHHIVPVREFIESDDHRREDAHRLDNVVSLCISCHRKADFGRVLRDELRALIS